MNNYDLSKTYIQYNEDVLNNINIANKLIHQACERMKWWFERDDIFFDYEDVDLKIRFMQKIKHSKGKFAGQYFELLPYQQWIVANIIGWKWKEDNTRVINTAVLMLSRKAGKTFFATALLLAIIVTDLESGGEGYMIANSTQQAGIAFEHCKLQCTSLDPQEKIFKRYRADINIPKLKSKIKVLCSETSRLDGLNPSVYCVDEYHEAKTNENVNILKTGQGMRQNPLGIIISTAGFNVGSVYPLYNLWEYCCKVLDESYEDDTVFAAIYQLDEGDDWKDENVWIKANPSLGATVSYKYMRDQIKTATQSPSNEVSIKTKNLNMWCQSSSVWIQNDYIEKVSQEVTLDSFKDEVCFGGVDLSAVSDLTSFSVMFPPNEMREKWPDKFVFKTFVYIPQEALEDSVNSDMYNLFKRHGYAIITSGNVVDYDYILNEQIKIASDVQLMSMEYDTYNATQWAINATNAGLPLEPYSQSLGNFNKPTKFLEMLILSGKAVIDSNPCVTWCFSNVELKVDYNDNCKPVKSGGDKNKKIDPVISMIQALGGYLNSPQFNPEIFSL